MNAEGKAKYYGVILAGGEGLRAGGDVPKQFQMLGGRPVVWWSLKRFSEIPGAEILLVMHPGFFDLWDMQLSRLPEDEQIAHTMVCGGRSRIESVKNALMWLENADGESIVSIHDAARPLVTRRIIETTIETVIETEEGGVPAIPVTDSLRILDSSGESTSVDRSRYVAVQTPQTFRLRELRAGYSREGIEGMTDDASIVQAAGIAVRLTEGSAENIKITRPIDFEIAESILRGRGWA